MSTVWLYELIYLSNISCFHFVYRPKLNLHETSEGNDFCLIFQFIGSTYARSNID